MSTIVVALDFSKSSINAFLHALSIAQKCQSNLDLVWVRKSAAEKDKFDTGGDPTKEVKIQFADLIEKYQPELPGNKISFKIRTGKVYKEISDEARDSKAMLVVTGTHGASVFVEFWIGSNPVAYNANSENGTTSDFHKVRCHPELSSTGDGRPGYRKIRQDRYSGQLRRRGAWTWRPDH